MKPLGELMDLSGKSAIVTGGSKGIGYGISYRLAEAGASVSVTDIDSEAGERVVNELKQKGWSAAFVQMDVSDENSVKAGIKSCAELFGPIDILVNNAGIYPNKPLSDMVTEDFERVLDVNLRGVFLTTKYVSEIMKQAGRGGKIINITSVDAVHPSMIGLAHYDASKHGVWGFTKNTALELAADKIWVNAVAPGGIMTPGATAPQKGQKAPAGVDFDKMLEAFMAKIPMHRLGDPDEIGKVVLFLASELSSYMTGAQIVVDGGALLG